MSHERENNMNNTEMNKEIWTSLRQKWDRLAAGGHALKVEFNVLKDPHDNTRDLAIDVVQNIDGGWVVQTVQRQPKEAYTVLGIAGLGLDQLIGLAGQAVTSVTERVNGQPTYDDEMHLFMKRISPEASEISGHIVSGTGQKVAVRANYQHYYILNAILEEISGITREEFAGLELHRDQGDRKVYFRFLPA
jgi:hypothetical protein